VVDLGTDTAILIAGITASAAIIGGLISSGANYIIEWQRGKREAEKAQRDKEARVIELRNQAYIRFLSVNEDDVTNRNENDYEEFHPEFVEESVAHIITYGSPTIANIVRSAYPFNSWDDFEGLKKLVMMELVAEKTEQVLPKGAAWSLIHTDD
jgi:hypothetical protein